MPPRGSSRSISAAEFRRDLSARNLRRAAEFAHETTFGSLPSVIYAEAVAGRSHGNFIDASYRRICAHPAWRRRLDKVYTAGRRVPRRHDRLRAELDCANSSDALLMNLFCYPGFLHRPAVCQLLGVEPGVCPEFGVRAEVPLTGGRVDRTEVDMQLGDYLVEAKLTETGFQQARPRLVERYSALDEVFDVESLPRRSEDRGDYLSYQLIRGVLAAHARQQRFLVLCDGRRADLIEAWFRIMRVVRCWQLRDRLRLLTWQELAQAAPPSLRTFLADKYGIEADLTL